MTAVPTSAPPNTLEAVLSPKIREKLGEMSLKEESAVWRRLQPLLERRDWKHGGAVLRFLSLCFRSQIFIGQVPVLLPGGSAWRLVLDDILETLAVNVSGGEVPRDAVSDIFDFLDVVRDSLCGESLNSAVRVGFSLLPTVASAEDFLVQLASDCTDRMLDEPGRGDPRIDWLVTIMARQAVSQAVHALDETAGVLECVVCGCKATAETVAGGSSWRVCGQACAEVNERRLTGTWQSSLCDFVNLFRSLCKVVSKPAGGFSATAVKRTAFRLIDVLLRQSGSHASLALYIKSELFTALLNHDNLSALTVDIFAYVVNLNSHLLTSEIGLWLERVFLPLLEASDEAAADPEILEKLVSAFAAVFSGGASAEVVLSVFLSFDCSMNMANLYERSLLCLTKLLRSSAPVPVSLKQPVLDCLRGLVETLRDHVELVLSAPSSAPGEHTRPVSVEKQPTRFASRPREGGEAPGAACGAAAAAGTLMDARMRKQQLEEAIALFNEKPNRGVQKLVSLGFIEGTVQEPRVEQLAEFLFSHGSLDKKAVGDYLGENTAVAKAVLGAFAAKFEFQQISLVDAMRKFLESFRLPGEGQKIDRILEQFAAKYYVDNAEVFASADVAYILSFSLIMLNTDLHSEKVKKKMSVEEFVKNNRGINADKADVPRELLEYLYSQIKEQPIKLKAESESRKSTASVSTKSRSSGEVDASPTSPAANFETSEALVPFMSVSAFPLLSAFSQEFDQFPDLAIAGLSAGVQVCGRLGLSLERDAFMTSLVGFTSLATRQHSVSLGGPPAKLLTEAKIGAIQAVLRLAVEEGDWLEEVAWQGVLTVVSEVARILLAPSREKKAPPTARVLISNVLLRIRALPLDLLAAFEGLGLVVVAGQGEAAAAAAVPESWSQQTSAEAGLLGKLGVDLDDVDAVFSSSVRRSGASIVKFVEELCRSAERELVQRTQTSFLLVKLVEVAAFNMDRIRAVWTRLWRHVASVFVVALAPASAVATQLLAVDALKQLTLKFLMTQQEAEHFHFQEELLRPLEAGFRSGRLEVKEMILSVVHTFVTVKAVRTEIKSGWLSVLRILHQAAAQTEFIAVYKNALITVTHVVYNDARTCTEHKADLLAVLLLLCRKQFKYGNHDLPVALRVLADFVAVQTKHDADSDSDSDFLVSLFRGLLELIGHEDYLGEARNGGLAFLLDLFKEDVTTDSVVVARVMAELLGLARRITDPSGSATAASHRLSEVSSMLLQALAQRLVRTYAGRATLTAGVEQLDAILRLVLKSEATEAASGGHGLSKAACVLSVLPEFFTVCGRLEDQGVAALNAFLEDLLDFTAAAGHTVPDNLMHVMLLGETRTLLERGGLKSGHAASARLREVVRASYERSTGASASGRLCQKQEKQTALVLFLVEEGAALEQIARQVARDYARAEKEKRKTQLGAALAEGLVVRWTSDLKRLKPQRWMLELAGDLILSEEHYVREKVRTLFAETLIPRLITE